MLKNRYFPAIDLLCVPHYNFATMPISVAIPIYPPSSVETTLTSSNHKLSVNRTCVFPQMEKLIDPTVWMDAATQVFYSLSVGFGSLIAFASYNPVNNNCKQDAIFMCTITVFTATFGAIDIFAVLGYKAVQNYNKCIAQ